MHPYSDLYCPICSKSLDEYGSCWITCEYEIDVDGDSLPALNRTQMLKKTLESLEAKLSKIREEQAALSNRKEAIQAELNSHSSQ